MHYSISYRVLIGQVDVSSHLSNVHYYELFKSALFSFLYRHNFSELVKPNDLWPVVFNESCEFYKEVFFDDIVTIQVFFSDISEKRTKYLCNAHMYNANGDKVAVWKSLHGIMNRKTRKIEPLPETAAKLFFTYNGSELLK